MEEKPPWVTCYLTDMLLSYVRDELRREKQIDYGALFRGIEGFETPSDPKFFPATESLCNELERSSRQPGRESRMEY